MQILRLNDLDYSQRQILEPIIKQQKEKEMRRSKGFPFIYLFFFGPFAIFLFFFITIWAIMFFQSLWGLLLPLGYIVLLAFIICSLANQHTKVSEALEKDDFYILYGYVDDIQREVTDTYSDASPSYEYVYIIENRRVKVNHYCFAGFNYNKTPIKCNRYFLLREYDNKIRKDITQYFQP